VFEEGAILLRPGAPSRLGESEEMRHALARHFRQFLELQSDEYADGGDILVAAEIVFIGLSRRTNRVGAAGLKTKLESMGRKACIVETPAGILHFKTAASLISEEMILATRSMAGSGVFEGFRILVLPNGEEPAANALRVNDTAFVGENFPRTVERLDRHGLRVEPLPMEEISKLDASLSCMSLRWMKGPQKAQPEG
jgi:dimethylargininase